MSKTLAQKGCCAPARDAATPSPPTQIKATAPDKMREGAIAIPAAQGLVGARRAEIADDGETPLRKARLKAFHMAPTSVTNAQFAEFVSDTGYVTEAERLGWSFVFYSKVPLQVGATQALPEATWWRRVDGATWRDIHGPHSQPGVWRPDHPVVQVSWNDARAYAAWVGGRLPTEAEWEHAARGGLGDVRFPWGDDEPQDTGYTPCNIWQGQFPVNNTAADGYDTTAPAQSFEPNGYGLFNMVGNVWEWTADLYKVKSLKASVRRRLATMKGYRLSKGGSFLCHRSYCYRYRIAARSGTSPDSAATHQGFRVVWSDTPIS